jgi:hypothetical protein
MARCCLCRTRERTSEAKKKRQRDNQIHHHLTRIIKVGARRHPVELGPSDPEPSTLGNLLCCVPTAAAGLPRPQLLTAGEGREQGGREGRQRKGTLAQPVERRGGDSATGREDWRRKGAALGGQEHRGCEWG